MSVSPQQLEELALSQDEYNLICQKLGRHPNEMELGLFGAMWSEHCGYKHTKALIRKLPAKSKRLLTSTGAENAGAIDIGSGMAVVMKVESHNHPSAVEPFQGAATGVGGIVRDILAMGARPIALLNSLRFGNPQQQRQKHLFSGVVAGISNYGNCIGVPDIGGEVQFDQCYAGNPLVNAMCIGLIDDGKLMRAKADAPGDLLILVGADTGRDGIHGASTLASRTFSGEGQQPEAKSAVQVGNPFLEKILIESCLEAKHLPHVSGIQDCGAAGITSAAVEMARNSNLGLRIDTDKVPCRMQGMSPYEIMLSESQERMLIAIKPKGIRELTNLFRKWDLHVNSIGVFTDNGMLTVAQGNATISSTPIEALTSPPEYQFGNPPKPQPRRQPKHTAPPATPDSPDSALLQMLASPNIASREMIYRQYDHQVQLNTVVPPGGDAAILRIKRTGKALAVAIDGNGRFCQLDPRTGAIIAVAEACRNLAATGAMPIALTDGLNFGDPANADVQYQLTQAIQGISEAANAFSIPVISGNASLYNESAGTPIHPTPIIGALGILQNANRYATINFKNEGDIIAVIGADSPWDAPSGLAGSEYALLFNAPAEGAPSIDLNTEKAAQDACRNAIQKGLLASAHDCSMGGAMVAIAESAITGGIGAAIDAPLSGSNWHAALFGESQSRIIISISPANLDQFKMLMQRTSAEWCPIGTVGGNAISVAGTLSIALDQAARNWHQGLPNAI